MDFAPTDLLVGEAQVIIAQLGRGFTPDDMDYDSEVVFVACPANSQVGFPVSRDGFVMGFKCTLALNFGIAIAIDVPGTNFAVGSGPQRGFVWAPYGTSPTGAQDCVGWGVGRCSFSAGDLINCRSLTATAAGIWIFLGYRRQPVSGAGT